jgi:hypothetical protein
MNCYDEIIEENKRIFSGLSNSKIRVNHFKIVEVKMFKGFKGLIEDISESTIK